MYYQFCGMVDVNVALLLIWKEMVENVLFIDALNTFYLWLYGVRVIWKNSHEIVSVGFFLLLSEWSDII